MENESPKHGSTQGMFSLIQGFLGNQGRVVRLYFPAHSKRDSGGKNGSTSSHQFRVKLWNPLPRVAVIDKFRENEAIGGRQHALS